MSFRSLCLLLLVPVVAGCAIGVPPNRQEFVDMYKDAKVFGKAEHFTINRSAKAVTTDVKALAQKCLNIRVVEPNYALKETGGSTTFRPRFESLGVSCHGNVTR